MSIGHAICNTSPLKEVLLDLQIAAHALAVGEVLVTNDQAMLRLPGLETEDWTRDV